MTTLAMPLHRRRIRNRSLGFSLFRFEDKSRNIIAGYGDGDFIRLRDESGNEWHGCAERMGDFVRFRFRDGKGRYATGVSDSYGIVLKDESGNVWRGFLQ